MARKILNSTSHPGSPRHWHDFPCDEWSRKRIRLKSEAFHQIAHPGIMISPETSDVEEEISEDEDSSKKLLVDI